MRYTIILPNNEKVAIEGDELRFQGSQYNLVVFKKEIGEDELLAGIFPKESALVVNYDCELAKRSSEGNDSKLNRQIGLLQKELETHQHHISELLKQSAKETSEIHKLKSRNLWQRILNL